MNYLSALILLLCSFIFSSSSFAHGADDHEHASAPTSTLPMAPRATAQTEDFELVAILQGRSLLIYLDNFNTNLAIPDAQIEINSGTQFKAIAKQISPGLYSIELSKGIFEKAGKYPLTITVQAGEVGDIMTTQLDIPELHEEEHSETHFKLNKWLIAALALFAFIVMASLYYRRKQTTSDF